MSKIRDVFYSIKYGIQNLIVWFPIIWKDRNWDQYYLYLILKMKLKNMERYQRQYGHALDADKTANKIRVCINLLERLIKNDYYDMAYKNHDKKWGELNFLWEKDINGNLLRLNRTNIKCDEDRKKEHKEYMRLCEHEVKLRKQDIYYLFKLMSKQIETWWD